MRKKRIGDFSKYVKYHREKERIKKKNLEEMRLNAENNAKIIGTRIGELFKPKRIYLFGSVLNSDLFKEYSDLDIAIEGLEIDDFYKAHKIAEDLSQIKLDFINYDRVENFVKERILRTGKIIYENKQRVFNKSSE